MPRINKELTGETIRFSVRLPYYQHLWLKSRSESTKGTDNFESMNQIIAEAVRLFMGLDN